MILGDSVYNDSNSKYRFRIFGAVFFCDVNNSDKCSFWYRSQLSDRCIFKQRQLIISQHLEGIYFMYLHITRTCMEVKHAYLHAGVSSHHEVCNLIFNILLSDIVFMFPNMIQSWLTIKNPLIKNATHYKERVFGRKSCSL